LQFLSKFSPLYERRAEIIAGKAEPTDTEVAEGKAADSDAESDEDDDEGGAKITEVDGEGKDKVDESGEKGIPEFWLTALRTHPAVNETIEDHDEEVSLAKDE
jgi:nucleosome assembly protein 1-like 1